MFTSQLPSFGSIFGRAPDPPLAELVASRLRHARESATEAAATMRTLVEGWQGPAAEAAMRETTTLAHALLTWADQAGVAASTVETLAGRLSEELARRRRVHEAVLAALGRVATLPADVHREVIVSLARASRGQGWQGQLVPLGPAVHELTVQLPRVGAVGWDCALSTLRSVLP